MGPLKTCLGMSERATADPHVLIIAAHENARRELELSLPDSVPRRSVDTAPQAEGLGSEVVVVGGDFPLAELIEVRAHPRLCDTPVVLFAPGKDLPKLDWQSASVWPVIDEHNAMGQLVGHVRRLMSGAGRGVA
jgi:hypothetical protein